MSARVIYRHLSAEKRLELIYRYFSNQKDLKLDRNSRVKASESRVIIEVLSGTNAFESTAH